MEWIDSHVHWEDEVFAADRSEALQRSCAAGVNHWVNAGSTLAANTAALKLARTEPRLAVGIGWHPHEAKTGIAFPGTELRAQLAQGPVVAVGETGLDYHRFTDLPAPDHEAQQQAFEQQLQLAQIFELPVIVHVREAMEDALRLLQAHAPFSRGGVMHCYAGGTRWLDEVLSLGFDLGFGATLTYPRADDTRAAFRAAPLERILLETDAPYLPPQTRRGQRNESAYLPETGVVGAQLKGVALEELAAATTQNAQARFHLGPGSGGTLVYDLKDGRYVNLTNRCTAHCSFCPRKVSRRLQTYDLTLTQEPGAEAVLAAIGDPRRFREIVFCGFGEPLLRLPVLLAVAEQVKARGGRVRVNTNGHADLIFGTDILPACVGKVDEWSVSLNTADPGQYDRLVRPAFPGAHAAVVDFIRRAAGLKFKVTATAVAVNQVELAQVERLAQGLGAEFRGRTYDRLGDPEDRA